MSQQVRLDQLTLAVAIIGLFALIGYKRGIVRELVATPAILLAPVISPWLGQALKPWVNRFYRLGLFALYGGLVSDDLTGVMTKVKKVPPLIQTDADMASLGAIVFLVIIVAGYLLGQRFIKTANDRVTYVMGGVMGAINGYLLIQNVVPRFWSAQYAVVVVPTGGLLQLLRGQAVIVLVVAFIALVSYGLRLARKK